jgi:hypothetical protein
MRMKIITSGYLAGWSDNIKNDSKAIEDYLSTNVSM